MAGSAEKTEESFEPIVVEPATLRALAAEMQGLVKVHSTDSNGVGILVGVMFSDGRGAA